MTDQLTAAQEKIVFQAYITRDLRTWGVWDLILGIAHLVGSEMLNAPFGILLLLAGGASFIRSCLCQ